MDSECGSISSVKTTLILVDECPSLFSCVASIHGKLLDPATARFQIGIVAVREFTPVSLALSKFKILGAEGSETNILSTDANDISCASIGVM